MLCFVFSLDLFGNFRSLFDHFQPNFEYTTIYSNIIHCYLDGLVKCLSKNLTTFVEIYENFLFHLQFYVLHLVLICFGNFRSLFDHFQPNFEYTTIYSNIIHCYLDGLVKCLSKNLTTFVEIYENFLFHLQFYVFHLVLICFGNFRSLFDHFQPNFN